MCYSSLNREGHYDAGAKLPDRTSTASPTATTFTGKHSAHEDGSSTSSHKTRVLFIMYVISDQLILWKFSPKLIFILKDHALYTSFRGIVLGDEAGKAIAEAFDTSKEHCYRITVF
jgi:hypothetical protein